MQKMIASGLKSNTKREAKIMARVNSGRTFFRKYLKLGTRDVRLANNRLLDFGYALLV